MFKYQKREAGGGGGPKSFEIGLDILRALQGYPWYTQNPRISPKLPICRFYGTFKTRFFARVPLFRPIFTPGGLEGRVFDFLHLFLAGRLSQHPVSAPCKP